MAKIKLTKNELKKQRDNLRRFTRYLPTLELKKKQLIQEVRTVQDLIDKLQGEIDEIESQVREWVGVFAQEVDWASLLVVKEIQIDQGNIAGIDIPIFRDVVFERPPYDFFETPLWVDQAIEVLEELIGKRAQIQVAEQQQDVLREELRITIQRIKLFEEIKIPEARENIRVVRIFLGDQMTAEMVRGKIAKSQLERKKVESTPA